MVLLAARFISEQPTIRDLLQNQGKYLTHLKGIVNHIHAHTSHLTFELNFFSEYFVR